MRWPWVSVARLDDAIEQVRYFRGRCEHLEEQVVRMRRHEAGMSELPRQPRPPVEKMPEELAQHIAKFLGKTTKKGMRDTAFKRHAGGEPWSSIMADMMPPETEEDA